VAIVTNPLFWIDLEPEVSIPLQVLSIINTREQLDPLIKFRQRAAADPYIFTRDGYLQMRHTLIYGAPEAMEPGFYDEVEPATTSPSTHPSTSPATP
jgi:ABC-type transporter lipoprotein component MlaA